LGYPRVQGFSWRGHACVKNLPRVGRENCAKFGGDWSDGSGVKRVHVPVRHMLTNQGPSMPSKNLIHFFVKQIFFSSDLYVLKLGVPWCEVVSLAGSNLC